LISEGILFSLFFLWRVVFKRKLAVHFLIVNDDLRKTLKWNEITLVVSNLREELEILLDFTDYLWVDRRKILFLK